MVVRMKRQPGNYNFYYNRFGELHRNCGNCRYGHGVSYTTCEKDGPGPDRFCGDNSVCDLWEEKETIPRLSWYKQCGKYVFGIVEKEQKA
jgi:hypothetical protein